MGKTITRENTKDVRNRKIVRRYHAILKRMGGVKFLTPKYEIMEEIAAEFNIRPSTVSRIIKNLYREG